MLYTKTQRIEKEFMIFKFSLLISKEKILESSQYEFIMKIYEEMKKFINDEYKKLKKLSKEELHNQRINFMVFYTGIYDDNYTNLIKYEKLVSIYDNLIEDVKLNDILSKISKDDILNFYKKYFIKNDLMVNIHPVN